MKDKKGNLLFLIFIVIFILLLVFIFIKINNNINKINNYNPNESTNDDNNVGIFNLNVDGNFNELNFKYDLSFELVSLANAMNIVYGPIDNPIISIKFDYFIDQSVQKVINNYFKDKHKKNVKYNNLLWIAIEEENIYIISYNKNVYVVSFKSTENIDELIDKFMSNIEFK